MAVGERVRVAREAAGISQKLLADKIGVSEYTIIRLEKGRRAAKSDELEKIATALDVPLSYLVGIDDGEAPMPSDVTPLAVRVRGLREYERIHVYSTAADISRCFVFSSRSGQTAISEAAVLKALKTLAAHGLPSSTIHGFLHTASTILHSRGENTLWIEKQLAHLDPNRIRAVYNKYEFIDERRGMLQRYADFLDSLKNGSD